ncbi:YbgC/FadM family acyl-CoA thioesterase [Photorhabdus laumondii subsp. laumondii]|uniref:Photorhabdus luminescens subsp. laumondii TTO1 complete genome segment 14/17 n=3 Tax=Photorhabdus laumondii TaxID=2218628 RepID=Q7N0L9_PHOLL|nr:MULTISPECIES: thioesterase family protein [Photorhabdus]PQQ38283.1 acyl-CoA thioesterase [Photorhabdus luminescens]AWK43471.1 thioesterase [Photorhabdus laumondii subsp. laumondii]AXG44149.1 acyl-CoA thioesterase [Photorhabdus laumondii subsp. laumondii]AXG48777.1 acyl-CoA thioesterase [Photorhabdus laumondii subsp. laumondii]KTL63433.1 thioesterase [Photorhabdus laumondii subsp. laumondii]
MSSIIKVHGYHIDLFQHVNNARYLEFLESARWEWLHKHSVVEWIQRNNVGFAVVNININYRSSAVLGDELEVDCRLTELRNRSGVFSQEIIRRRNNQLIADAKTTFVWIDRKTQRALSIEGELREIMGALVKTGQ